MHDTYTRGLLTVIDEALQPPAHLTPSQLAEWHSHTLRGRLPLIREALRIAHEENDAELATQLIDEAVANHSTPTAPPSRTIPQPRTVRAVRAVGGDGASLPPPARNTTVSSCEGELPIPEHVLCTLLYKHWCMTIVGTAPEETFMAFRPFGWSGQGDPSERITAPTRHELLRLLCYRFLGRDRPEGPDPTAA
jgi:hypothetical protein